MSLNPYAAYLPENIDPDADLFGDDFDDFGDEALMEPGLDEEIDEMLSEDEIDALVDGMEFGAEEDEEFEEFDELDAELDAMGDADAEFGVALRMIPNLKTSKLKKIVTGRFRRKKIRMAALKELMRRESMQSAQPQTQYQQTSNQYYQQPPPVYYGPAQQSSAYYYQQPRRRRWFRRAAPRHSTGERQTFTPQQEVARQQALARANERRVRRIAAQKQNRANQQERARARAAAIARMKQRRAAAQRARNFRRQQRQQQRVIPGMIPRSAVRFGQAAPPPAGFTLQPKLGAAMWQHKFKTLAVLGGMYAIGAYVGKERSLDALGPIGDGFENLGRRIRTARA